MKDLITVAEISERYGVARHTASEILRQLPYFTVGKKLFARSADLEAWERDRMMYPLPTGRRKTAEPHLIPRKRA